MFDYAAIVFSFSALEIIVGEVVFDYCMFFAAIHRGVSLIEFHINHDDLLVINLLFISFSHSCECGY